MHALELKKSDIAAGNLYILEGQNGFLINRVLSVAEEAAGASRAETENYTSDSVGGLAAALESADTSPMGGSVKVVRYRHTADKLSESDKATIQSYAAAPSETCIFLFVGSERLGAAIEDAATIECGKTPMSALTRYIADTLASAEYKTEPYVASQLAETCDEDAAKAEVECRKLMTYCASNKLITVADVAEVVCRDTESTVFDAVNAFVANNFALGMRTLDALVARGEKESKILAALTSNYRRILTCVVSSLDNASLAKVLGVKIGSVNIARKNAEQGKRRRRDFVLWLKSLVDKLNDIEYGFKRGKMSPSSALSLAVCELMA